MKLLISIILYGAWMILAAIVYYQENLTWFQFAILSLLGMIGMSISNIEKK